MKRHTTHKDIIIIIIGVIVHSTTKATSPPSAYGGQVTSMHQTGKVSNIGVPVRGILFGDGQMAALGGSMVGEVVVATSA